MKRCPTCEFIYEDDQSLCDMDGILLVFDSQQLPKPRVSAVRSRRSQWRNRIVTVFAGLVLAAILGLVYYVSTNRQRAYQPTQITAGQSQVNANDATAASGSTRTPGETNNSNLEEKPVSPETSPKEERKEPVHKPKSTENPTVAKSAADKKTKAKSTSTEKAQSSTQTKKADSKIGSLIKKTGSLLKKPFKF